MKLTQANLIKLLASLGLQDVQVVEDDKDADQFNGDEIINKFLDTKKPIFLQNFETEILPEKLKAEAGKFGGNLKNSIKKLSNSQIKDSDLAGKTDAEVLQIFADFLHKDKDTSTEDLRTQIKNLSEGQQSTIDKLKEEYEGKLSGKDKQFDGFQIESYLGNLVNGLPLLGEDPAIKIGALKSAIESNYSPMWNRDKKELELREKQNPERFAQLNENTLLTPKTYAENFFKGLGMVKTDMSKENATDHIDKGNGGGNSTDFQNRTDMPFASVVAGIEGK
ncbi:hypothetical protein NAL32_07530 [Chryseobacterium sp. Ch-15]|uniref:Uncharacterized protein n=1 Tax=Chryseobacterium muglaense TaxID=2893752 RepID=A0A9Q3US19_9FLAO|nr:hypothetical protein [Chryseobacterium muglaense]MBD3904481.1 hypothetical protein [Chryseobacterium muglaense]MCC9032700.1 hypothetical protein [Chryseobacterium muglaense]MCM2554243.1 hypothetical protein [Chryseobacterium muglaense]